MLVAEMGQWDDIRQWDDISSHVFSHSPKLDDVASKTVILKKSETE